MSDEAASRRPAPLRPARPDTGLTDDGRRLRVTTSYARRGSRMNPRQQKAWDAYSASWVIEPEDVEGAVQGTAAIAHCFDRPEAPLVIEVGSGRGHATASLAAHNPHRNVLALEVWQPGVAETLGRAAAAGASNVRALAIDAAWVFENLLTPRSVAEVWTFFPDPWHKARHHKRRLVNDAFAGWVGRALRPGGRWRLATDWADYAEHVDGVVARSPGLTGGRVERWDARPVTHFEKRALAQGRPVVDFCVQIPPEPKIQGDC